MASDVTLAELKASNADYYLNLVAFSILLYDYCLTFVAEVERCWRVRQLNWGLGLFYLNRYLVLFGHVPIMLEFFWSTSNPNKAEICHHLQSFHQFLAVAIQIVVASMLIMRIYALYDRSRKVLVMYIVVAVLIVVVGCWAMLGGKKGHQDLQIPVGCGATLSREKAIRLGAAWAGMFIFDLLVFCMTLYKAIVLPRPEGTNILDILFRDGAIYFGVIVGSNLANILTFMLGGPRTRGVATAFTNVISSVMVSRLALNLRHPSLRRPASVAASTAAMTNPDFSFVQQEYLTRTSDTEGHNRCQ